MARTTHTTVSPALEGYDCTAEAERALDEQLAVTERAISTAQATGTYSVQIERGAHAVFVVHYDGATRIASSAHLSYDEARRTLFRLV